MGAVGIGGLFFVVSHEGLGLTGYGPSGGVYPSANKSKCALSAGEIQCLRRLMRESILERISRSWHLVRRSVALVCRRIYTPGRSAAGQPQPLCESKEKSLRI